MARAAVCRPAGSVILAESGKSREREGGALAQATLGFLFFDWCSLGAPTPRPALEHVAVMQQAIEHGADGGNIAEHFAPVVNRAIGSQQCTAAFVAAHDDFQQILGGGMWQLAHAEVIQDQQRNSCY